MGAPANSLDARPGPKSAGDPATGLSRPLWNTRVALMIGFGGLLLTIALAGGDAFRVLLNVRREDEQIRRQFLFRNHILNEVRSEVYLSGTYVREYLLDPEPVRAETFRANIEGVRKQIESAIEAYGRQPDTEARTQYSALTAELSRYWAMLGPILRWSDSERRERGYAFLRDEVFTRRAAMLEVAGRIADLNEQQLTAGSERVVGVLVKFQTRLGVILLASLALGLGMATFSTRKILRLEAKSQVKYQEVEEARRQLTHLSAMLVQAEETERRLLARELHDDLTQKLVALSMEASALSKSSPESPDAISRRMRDLGQKIGGLADDVHRMSHQLHPAILDDLGLEAALRDECTSFSQRRGIPVRFKAEDVPRSLPGDIALCLFRVAQESLRNIGKHAGAKEVRVRLAGGKAGLDLFVEDVGNGFEVEQARGKGGLGLISMEERVRLVNGDFKIRSQPGVGTEVEVHVPLPEKAS